MAKCSAKNRRCTGGDEWCIGGTLRIEDGATLDVAEGATVNGLGGGVTDYNDLENPPTYNKIIERTLVDVESIVSSVTEADGVYTAEAYLEAIEPNLIETGKTYHVEFNGSLNGTDVEISKDVVSPDSNRLEVSYGESEYDFFIINNEDNVYYMTVMYASQATTGSIKITCEDANDVPIDTEFIARLPQVQIAEVGQVVRVKAVDSNGVPTEWEAADMGGGGDTVMFYCPSAADHITLNGGHLFIDEDCQIEATKDDLLNAKHSLIRIKFTYYDYDTFSYALNFNLTLAENKEKVLIHAMDPTSSSPKLMLFIAV